MPADPIPSNTASPASAPDHPPDELVLSAPPPAERAGSLEQCETKLREILRVSMLAAGTILRRIRDEKLYEESQLSFEDYLLDHWDWTYSYAHRLIKTADFCDYLVTLPIGKVAFPTAESQVRPLLQLKDRQRQGEAWEKAVTEAGGKVPTAEKVKKVVDSFVIPKPRKEGKKSPERSKPDRVVAQEGEDEVSQQETLSQQSPVLPLLANEGESNETKPTPNLAPEDLMDPADTAKSPLENGEPPGGPATEDAAKKAGSQNADEGLPSNPAIHSENPLVVTADPSRNETVMTSVKPPEPASCPPPVPEPPPNREHDEVQAPSSGQDGGRPEKSKPDTAAVVKHDLADGSEATSQADPQSSIVPARLIRMTIQLIGHPKQPSSNAEKARRQRAALGVAEILDRMARDEAGLMPREGLNALDVAIKRWSSTFKTAQAEEQKRRKTEGRH